MANLVGSDIGTNYKGILNLGTTINVNLSTTLQPITDGDGNASTLQLSTTGIAVTSPIQYDWLSAPTGVANKSTMWFDATGRMNWRPGTGFIRTFDATGITANRTYTLPDLTTTIAGLAVAQTFTAAQTINNTLNVGGIFTNAARMHVRGDGTSPIVNFEDLSGTSFIRVLSGGNSLTINNGGGVSTFSQAGGNMIINNQGNNSLIINTGTSTFFTGISMLNVSGSMVFDSSQRTNASGTGYLFRASQSATTNGAFDFNAHQLAYTINNSGVQTGRATGLFINATETALSGITHNLIDARVGGVSRFSVDRLGAVSAYDLQVFSNRYLLLGANASGTSGALINSFSQGQVSMTDAGATTGISALRFGRQTDIGIFNGTGSPEGVVTAPQGSIYMNRAGGSMTTVYAKTSGTGNAGWEAVA